MAATFGDPLTLAKHEISPKKAYDLAPVFASYSKGLKTEYATTGVHAEGINIIDLTSLQTEAATLLGPDASFACPPVTRVIEKEQAERIRQTYAILNSETRRASAKRPQTLSLWSSNEGLASLEQVHSVTLATPAVALYAPDSIPDKVVLISSEGTITTYDSKLQKSDQESSSSESRKLVNSFVFDSAHCKFARGKSPSVSGAAIVVTVLKRRNEVYLGVSLVGQHVETVGEAPIQIPGNEILSASCNADGCLALLDSNGSIFSFMIEPQNNGIALSSLETLALRGITTSSMSLCCLESTHVLVTGVEVVNSDIVVLLWDVQFGVLLAEKKIVRPPLLSAIPANRLQLSMTFCDGNQTLLNVSSAKPSNKKEASTSGPKAITMIIPHSIQVGSSLASAIGRAKASENWLRPVNIHSTSGSTPHKDGREVMLESVTNAIESGQPEVADKLFFEWEAEQKAVVKALAKEEAKRQMAALAPKRAINGHAGGSESEDGPPDTKITVRHVHNQIDWGHSFLAKLMQAVLGPTGTRSGSPTTFLSKIPAYFLERKLVSNQIIEGGILKVLQERGDWLSIRWLLRNTVDVSEDHLMALLLHSVHLYRQRSKTKQDNTMDVDESSPVNVRVPFPVTQVLGHVIAYPTSAPPLRLAIRQHFTEMEDVIVLIETVNSWISESANKTLALKLGDINEELKRESHEKAVERDGLPRLDLLVSFGTCLLDALLLNLLQYRRAHRPLRIMAKRLASHLPYLENLDRLRGPLEPFVQADRLSRRPWEERRKGPKARTQKDDNYELNVNQYQVEEFFV
ncbi:hypothetical protein M408DRAFT_22959 [Serendipita vermifera MAFF 305830]|uniref:Uncharacterized protein n=1 Tax=Serendipita vermifera MAFF 305830 TaxID=933852 RepID=A0A0C3BDZ2_SERVB|nr:hypothetical protein M408DRAFT_22959 [Serendipita vermifera MAFF 305830]